MPADIYSCNIYMMTDSWTNMAMTTAALMNRPREQVSSSELDTLLRGRKFGQGVEDMPMDMNPSIADYDTAEMQELETFCKARGIIGVNFGKMSPSAILQMLKGKQGIREQTTKKGLLNG